MDKKEAFKVFAKGHPELVGYIKEGKMNWQNFYEIYDIYGEDASAWSSYLKGENITDKLKNIDMNSIQEHIKTAQKALDIVSELTGKEPTTLSASIPKVPRPLNQFFED